MRVVKDSLGEIRNGVLLCIGLQKCETHAVCRRLSADPSSPAEESRLVTLDRRSRSYCSDPFALRRAAFEDFQLQLRLAQSTLKSPAHNGPVLENYLPELKSNETKRNEPAE
jgi:hypothetical protein